MFPAFIRRSSAVEHRHRHTFGTHDPSEEALRRKARRSTSADDDCDAINGNLSHVRWASRSKKVWNIKDATTMRASTDVE